MKRANRIVMTVAGVLFIIGSLLKIHQLLTEPIVSKGFWESWEFFVIQIPLELGLGIWLVSGLFRKAGWLISVLAFGLFIVVTLQKGLMGAESCGCFGRVHVSPWITFSLIDIPLFLLLLIFRPKGCKLFPPPWPSAKHFFGVAVPTFILLAAIVPMLIFNKPAEKTNEYELVQPEEWVATVESGQVREQWPLLEHIDIAESIRTGLIVTFMYHYDCTGCREAVPLYEQMNQDISGDGSIRFAFIKAPPYAPEGKDPVPADTTCLTGKLDTSKDWIVATPLVVVLKDGVVINYWESQSPGLEELVEAVFSN